MAFRRVDNRDSPSWKGRLALGRWGGVSGPWVVALGDSAAAEVGLVGGKGAGLHRLVALGTRVPVGFVVTTAAFAAAVAAPEEIEAPLRALPEDAPVAAVEEAAAQARAALTDAIQSAAARGDVPVLDAVRAAYRELGAAAPPARRPDGRGERRGGWRCRQRRGGRRCWGGHGGRPGRSPCGRRRPPRTPPTPRYAGEHDSYLDVVGPDAVADAVVACWASLYTARAVAYRRGRPAGPMAVVVQRMVAARAAGVFMTLNPANGDRADVRLRGGLGARRAPRLGRGDPRPLRRQQDQRRGRAPRDRPQAHPTRQRAGPSPSPTPSATSPASPTTSWPSCCASAGPSRPRRVHRRTASSPSTTTASTCCKPVRRRSGRSAPAPSPAAAPRWKPSSPP